MLVLGHRGAVDALHPENTLASADRALRQGADGVEVDVRLTADIAVVCHHDPGLDRTAGVQTELADLLLAELPLVSGHLVHDLVVSSFDRPLLQQVRQLLDLSPSPTVRTALLGRPGLPFGTLLRRAVSDGHDEVHPHVLSLLTRLDLVRSAAQQAISVTGWTVNRSADLRRLAVAGVEAAICDAPALALSSVRPERLSEAV